MIELQIKATNILLTDAIREYVEGKISHLEKLVDEHDTSANAQVEVGKSLKAQHSGNIFRAEINLHVAGENLYVEANRDDLYAAIDEVKDEMSQRLRKLKTKRQTSVRKGETEAKESIKKMYRQE